MITLNQYAGPHSESPDFTPQRQFNATKLLAKCTSLQEEMEKDGVHFPINPNTKSQVSGQTYGGFRPKNCPIGSVNSAHKTGEAVDIYDPNGEIDKWCMSHVEILKNHGIHIEHPSATPGWSHWTDRAPPSGRQVFYP
jgi:hypothetical protein